jgi:hypothetical protein
MKSSKILLILSILSVGFSACTITIEKNRPPHKSRTATVHRQVSHPREAASRLVTRDWMEDYWKLEAQFKYSIRADHQITPDGDGFRVEQSVIQHYDDLKAAEAAEH